MTQNITPEPLGPTGEICRDLPSPYLPDCDTGLLHLPRFIAKIRKHLAGELPKSYQKNFCRGFDRFLCMHLGIDPQQVVDIVKEGGPDETVTRKLRVLLPEDIKVAKWNRELVQKGMSEAGREFIQQNLEEMGIPEKAASIVCVADLIEIDEGRIPGYEPAAAIAKKLARENG